MNKRGFCRFYKNLYFGDSVKKHNTVKWKLYHGAGQLRIYVITRPFADGDQLDIMHCAFLKQPYYRQHPVMVYGIAGSYDEAIDLVIKISDEAAECGMTGQLLEYLEGNV